MVVWCGGGAGTSNNFWSQVEGSVAGRGGLVVKVRSRQTGSQRALSAGARNSESGSRMTRRVSQQRAVHVNTEGSVQGPCFWPQAGLGRYGLAAPITARMLAI